MKRLLKKRALVTGGGKRLGRAIVMALAQEGCDVIIHYHTSRNEAERTAAETRALGVRAELVGANLSSPTEVETLAEKSLELFGGLELLVNSASSWPEPERIFATHGLRQETVAELDQSFAVNARAPFLLIQHLSPALERSNGVIVNILDQSISEPFLSRSAHTVSKFALLGVTELAAATLLGKVRVHGLELGRILPSDGISPQGEWLGVERVQRMLCDLAAGEGELAVIQSLIH